MLIHERNIMFCCEAIQVLKNDVIQIHEKIWIKWPSVIAVMNNSSLMLPDHFL